MDNHYSIEEIIVLGFIDRNGQYDSIIDPGNGTIMFAGADIIYVDKTGHEHVSVTSNHAIEVWLRQGKIKQF